MHILGMNVLNGFALAEYNKVDLECDKKVGALPGVSPAIASYIGLFRCMKRTCMSEFLQSLS